MEVGSFRHPGGLEGIHRASSLLGPTVKGKVQENKFP